MGILERICARCEYRTTRPVDRCPICDLPLEAQARTWTEQRRAVRVPLSPGVQGMLDSQVAVTVVDLSPLGACIEHAEPLLAGEPCLLTFDQPEMASLRLPACVVWSRAYPAEPSPGQTRWMYRSGVEFRGLPLPVLRDLCVYLDRVTSGGQGTLSGAVAPRNA